MHVENRLSMQTHNQLRNLMNLIRLQKFFTSLKLDRNNGFINKTKMKLSALHHLESILIQNHRMYCHGRLQPLKRHLSKYCIMFAENFYCRLYKCIQSIDFVPTKPNIPDTLAREGYNLTMNPSRRNKYRVVLPGTSLFPTPFKELLLVPTVAHFPPQATRCTYF